MFDFKGKVVKTELQRSVRGNTNAAVDTVRKVTTYEDPECSKCGSKRWITFVCSEGQGIRCKECLHEKMVFKALKKFERRDKLRARMLKAWEKQKKEDKF